MTRPLRHAGQADFEHIFKHALGYQSGEPYHLYGLLRQAVFDHRTVALPAAAKRAGSAGTLEIQWTR